MGCSAVCYIQRFRVHYKALYKLCILLLLSFAMNQASYETKKIT